MSCPYKLQCWIFLLSWIFIYQKAACRDCSTSGLQGFGDEFYAFSHVLNDGDVSRTFSETRSFCQSLGGDLPVITSQEQNNFIAENLARTKSYGHYWIGLDYTENNVTHVWINGTPVRYTNWDSPLYTDGPPYCAVMRSRLSISDPIHGRWNRVTCSSARKQICQIPAANLNSFGAYHYILYSLPGRTFAQTRAYCQSLGGDVPIITSAAQNNFIKSNLPVEPGVFYIGLEDVHKEGWSWIDGTTPSYTNWQPDPLSNDQGPPYCAVIRAQSNVGDPLHGMWDRRSCLTVRKHICQIPILDDCRWTEFGGSQNRVELSQYTSPESARSFCQSNGGDLAMMKTQEINNFLSHLIESNYADEGSCYWFGLRKRGNGPFTWVDGTLLNRSNEGFTNWYEGEPNEACSWACVHASGGFWYDYTPSTITNYACICERTTVSSVCPVGWFGVKCSQECHCKYGTACEKDSGYCAEVQGICDVGYATESVDFPSSCSTYSGCYSSCSKTCHCSGGAEDCDSVTGDCFSSTCHPRWMGDQCQTDRFETSLQKTNPGVAIFSCAFTVVSGQAVVSDFVKVFSGNFSSDPLTTLTSSIYQDRTINNSFIDMAIRPEDPIFCSVGDPGLPAFAFLRLPARDFFVLPTYNMEAELFESGFSHALIRWRPWDPNLDTGDGPIVGYKVYVRSGSNVVLAQEVQNSCAVNSKDRSERSANGSGMIQYNVTGLGPGSTYTIRIAAIREGVNGEGEQGPKLTFTTEFDQAPPIAYIIGGSVGAILVTTAIILFIAIRCRPKRKRKAETESFSNTRERKCDIPSRKEDHVYEETDESLVHTYSQMVIQTRIDDELHSVPPAYDSVIESPPSAMNAEYEEVPSGRHYINDHVVKGRTGKGRAKATAP